MEIKKIIKEVCGVSHVELILFSHSDVLSVEHKQNDDEIPARCCPVILQT